MLNDYNTVLLKDKNTDYDVLIKVKTEGYKATIYKSSVTIKTALSEKEKKYYVVAKYDKGYGILKLLKIKNLINFNNLNLGSK